MLNKTTKFFLRHKPRFPFSEAIPVKSFYRRKLPENLVAFDSPEGKQIFRQGLTQGHCESFFTWVQQFITQSEVSTCSSASMAMMLNSLGVDPGVSWKGIWRWYDDYNINHMDPDKIIEGLTLQEFHHLAQLNSVRSMAFSPLEGDPEGVPPSIRKCSLDFFRNCVKMCSMRNDALLTVNFHRKTLGQTGTGHYSPLAAFNANKDMVLILDVAKFKYDSYWCRLQTLYESFKAIDLYSDYSRGFVINRKNLNHHQPSQHTMHQDTGYRVPFVKSSSSAASLLIEMLEDKKNHYLLIPLLYDYHTSTIASLDQKLEIIGKAIGQQDMGIDNIMNDIGNQALVLLNAFKLTQLNDVLRFLLLVLTESPKWKIKQLHNTSNELVEVLGFIDYLKKTYVYLQG